MMLRITKWRRISYGTRTGDCIGNMFIEQAWIRECGLKIWNYSSSIFPLCLVVEIRFKIISHMNKCEHYGMWCKYQDVKA
jgi:hypothetical protein